MNAYIAISGSANPTYDPNGNLLTGPIASALASLTYDRENRLTTSNLGGSVNSYTYDALGRISTLTYSLNGVSTTEVYTWTGWTLLYRELIQNAVVVEKFRYTWGLDVSGTLEGAGGVGGLLAIERNVNNHYSWDIRYPHYDANGNIMALSNSSGQISARYRYDAFGKTILSTDVDGTGWNTKNIHGFSTKPTLGNHKLHYYGYRWYDASNGRWINRDPIEEKGGLNLYGFVGNDGVGKWDFLGMSFADWINGVINGKIKRPISPIGVANKVIWIKGPSYIGDTWVLLSSSVEYVLSSSGQVCGCSRTCNWGLMQGHYEDMIPNPNPIQTKSGKMGCDKLCPSKPWF